MPENIKVNIDKPDVDLNTARKYKNFHGFMSTYQQMHTQAGIRRMWYRDKKKMAWIAILICLLLLWILGEL